MIRPAVCLAALLTLTACLPPVRVMPAPALFLNGEHNLFAANANLDRSAQIQVLDTTSKCGRYLLPYFTASTRRSCICCASTPSARRSTVCSSTAAA